MVNESELEQTGADWCRLEQTGADWCTLEQTGADWCRLEQTGADWSRLEQTGAEWCRLEQTGADWSRLEQTGAHFCYNIQHIVRISLLTSRLYNGRSDVQSLQTKFPVSAEPVRFLVESWHNIRMQDDIVE